MNEIVDAEIVEEGEVTGTEIVAAADFARPVITPDEAASAAQTLRELIAKVLIKDKHYMTTTRNQKRGKQWVKVERDVLLKAGAEELGKVFGLAVSYSELTTRKEEGIFYASVHATASNSAGRALGESYGFFDSTERKDKDGNLQDTPANTIVKMAQKRAFVGAIMAATGTSELFTQDIEDAAPTTEQGGLEDRMSSAPERLLLKELFAQKGGKTLIQAGDWLREQGAKADSQLWVARQVLALCLKGSPAPAVEPELPPDPPLSDQEVPAPEAGKVSEADDDIPFDPDEPTSTATSYNVVLPGKDGQPDYLGVVVVNNADDHIVGAAGPAGWSKGKNIEVLRSWVEKNGGQLNVID